MQKDFPCFFKADSALRISAQLLALTTIQMKTHIWYNHYTVPGSVLSQR
jgi:hypothetical protein